MRKFFSVLMSACLFALLSSCNEVNSDRIPYANVHVDLSYNWVTYGVHSLGEYNYFIRSNDLSKREPSNFPFNANTYTGFGGLLLTCDANNTPLVYDMACPVEVKRDVIVRIDPAQTNIAECPVCHSRYDVTEFFGSPVSGPAKEHRYGLKTYVAKPDGSGYVLCN